MSKSYVTVEQHCCPVCCKTFDTGAILLDKHMRDQFDHHTVTGWSLCPDDKEKFDKGYVAIVAVDRARSEVEPNGNIEPAGAYRLGPVAHVKRDLAKDLFTIPIPDEVPLIFADLDVLETLSKLAAEANSGA